MLTARGVPCRVPKMQGVSLIEVLITLLIVGVGLLGLAGLQARAITAEAESYARGQALMLLNDMTQRIESNLVGARTELTGTTSITNLGASYTCLTVSGTTEADMVKTDLCQWAAALTASPLASPVGCIVSVAASAEILVSVAWRGRDSGYAPTAAQSCGSGTISSGRKVVSARIRIPTLGG
jgi:type IV pilus assembly protein PilV